MTTVGSKSAFRGDIVRRRIPLLGLHFFIVMLVLSVFAGEACAQLGYTVDVLYPQVGQVGTTVDVTIEGNFLHEPEDVLFYQPGIVCTKLVPITELPHFRNGSVRKVDQGRAARLSFEIADDAQPGEYHLRVRTRDNLSELLTFWVTAFPVVQETHPWEDTDSGDKPLRNDSPQHAQPIPLNCSVAGYHPHGPPQDHDWYSVECKAGQRLSVEVVAARLGTWHYGGMNDPAVSIFDNEGQELARNDDNALHTQDPVASTMIPRDGRYTIHLRQQMDYETNMRHYILHVGTFARPGVAFPLGGQAGTSVPVTLLGDASGDLRTVVTMPPRPGPFEAAHTEVYSRRGPGEPKPPSPNRIHVSPFGDVTESPGHQSVDNPQSITGALPLAINGIIESEGEVDWYQFKASKGDRYRVFAYGKTLDSELDPRVWIRPAAGTRSSRQWDEDDSRWEPHDLVGHHYRHQTKRRLDPVFMFEPDADGEWLIGIGDTRREFSSHHIYRVEFQPHVDGAFIHFPAYPSLPSIVRDRIVLFPGQSYCRPVAIQPGFGSTYSKPLQLKAKSLPPGVSIECQPFTQSAGIVPVLFHALPDSPIGAELVDLIVEPVDPADRGRFRGGFVQNTPATNRRGDFAMYFNRTRKMALAVVNGAPFDLRIESPSVPLVQNGELALIVNVERMNGFDGAVYCEMDWLPPGVNKQPPLIIPAGESKGVYRLRASNNAAAGEYQITITGRENAGGNPRTGTGFHYISSPVVALNVGEPYVTVQFDRAAIERETIGTITAEITHHKAFSGQASLQLGRLPFGVEQVEPSPTIQAGDRSAIFQVKVRKDCLVGQYKDIVCEVLVSDGGQQIRQQTGSGILRVDPERQASTTSNTTP